jgi:hypothetical protein
MEILNRRVNSPGMVGWPDGDDEFLPGGIGAIRVSLTCLFFIANHYPHLCRAVDNYCERTSPALDAEPTNALTNVAFLIAAWGVWRLHSDCPDQHVKRLVQALIVIMLFVGLGSFLFHTVATRWAEWGDVIPILVFMLLYLWLVLTCFFTWSVWLKIVALAFFFAVTFYLEAAVPSAILWGGALYLPTLLALIAISAVLHWRQPAAGKAMFIATGVFLLSFTGRTLDSPICTVFPLGTHFVWHLLNATLLYLLVRAVILYGPPRMPTPLLKRSI